ncbi:hypothetical protein ACFQ6H_25615 [Rhodococcus sp. NPDC056506]|uniref:hypothetical protein n=1 Tax=Rhodococcus sp. NPDC056506 TaxID=3345844 RepID=UPI00366F7AC3
MHRLDASYVLPHADHVNFGHWQNLDGNEAPLGDEYPDWGGGTDIHLSRTLRVDETAIRAELRLTDEVPLRITTSWIASTSKIRRCVGHAEVAGGVETISVVLSGNELGGIVTLRTTLSIGANPTAPAGFPRLPGSVLALDEHRFILEGQSSTFPIGVIDFRTTPFDDNASWHLTTSTQLEASFTGRFRLEINDRDKALVGAIEATKPNNAQKALLDELMSGVGGLLVELAGLADAEGTLSSDIFDEDSIGGVLQDLLKRSAFVDPGAGDGPDSLAHRLAAVQGAVRRLGFGRAF